MKPEKIIAVRTSKTVYRDGDKMIKVFNEDYKLSDVLREAFNLSLVGETELKVQKFIEVSKIEDKWALVNEYIDGETLEQLMQKNPDKFDEYLDKFVDIQLEMHKYTVPGLNRLVDKMHRKIKESELDATARYELHTRLDSIDEHVKLCHGDFHPSNIIIDKNNMSYIIDWSHATRGNASADAARTYLLFWLSGDINGAEKYLKLFCKKSDTARQYVDKWISIVSASRLVKAKPEEREFLLHWTNIADYE